MVFSVLKAVAFVFGLQDMTAMGQPIQRCSGEPFASEDLCPVLEREVRRHDEAVPLVGSRDDIE